MGWQLLEPLVPRGRVAISPAGHPGDEVIILFSLSLMPIDIESLPNRLLKVCNVLATSAGLPRVSFFFSFLFLLLQPLTVLMKQTRQAVRDVKQSIFLDVYVDATVE
jgi:hypothetical protein